MRWMAWWCVVLACGEAEQSAAPGAGGKGEAGGPSGEGTSGGSGRFTDGGHSDAGTHAGRAGNGVQASTSGDTGQTSEGGASQGGSSGGHGNTDAGAAARAPSAGSSGDAGSGGAAGAQSSTCAGEYTCRCECCGAEEATLHCYYPELGDDLAAVIAADDGKGTSPSCARDSCAAPRRIVCCDRSDADGSGSYRASFVIGGLDRIILHRESSDSIRCTRIELVRPGGQETRLELPEGWSLGTVQDYACADESNAAASSRRWPIGALGFARFGAGCALDLDLTLFFPAEGGGVDAVRFESQALPVPSLESVGCATGT